MHALCKAERFTPEDVESVRIFGSERMRITVEPLALRQVPRTQRMEVVVQRQSLGWAPLSSQ